MITPWWVKACTIQLLSSKRGHYDINPLKLVPFFHIACLKLIFRHFIDSAWIP